MTTHLVAKVSERQGFPKDKICKTHDPMVHLSAFDINVTNRDKNKSFTRSVIRETDFCAVTYFGMRCKFGNAVRHQKVFRENLLTNSSFKTNTGNPGSCVPPEKRKSRMENERLVR